MTVRQPGIAENLLSEGPSCIFLLHKASGLKHRNYTLNEVHKCSWRHRVGQVKPVHAYFLPSSCGAAFIKDFPQYANALRGFVVPTFLAHPSHKENPENASNPNQATTVLADVRPREATTLSGLATIYPSRLNPRNQ